MGETAAHREVLIVDDDADVRRCLVELLSRAGIRACHAFDGQDALDQVRSGAPPCVMVVDLDMPRLAGADLVAALQADPGRAAIPVVSMTAGRAPLPFCPRAHLAKPFVFGDLLEVLFRECRSCGVCDGPGPVVGSIFDARRRYDAARR